MPGSAIALSKAKIEKSTPFPKVNKIIFDEFILDKGYHHYLPDEVVNFLELYSTVARNRDVIALFISNALTMTNPYFLYFNLSLPYGKNIAAKNDILLEMVVEQEYTNKVKESRFSKIIAGTDYAKYAEDNEFFRDDKNFVQKKTVDSSCIFYMRYKGEDYGVWIDYKQGLQFVSKDIDPSCRVFYSVTLDDHTPNTMLLKGNKRGLFNQFLDNYKFGLVRFESINIKNICKEILKLTI